MFAKKRTGGAAASGKKKQAQHTGLEADLFNNRQRIMVTNISKDKWPKIPKTDEMWAQIKKLNMPAHNPYPGAPEQLRMVNNLIGDNAKQP